MKINKPVILPVFGAMLSIVFWIADSFIDSWYFEDQQTFYDSLIHPDKTEIWMRGLVVFLFIIFSLYAKNRIVKLTLLSRELMHYKDDLEKHVNERTMELNREIRERKKIENELKRLASTDSLTLLFNRRKFEELLEREIKLKNRTQIGFSILLCDIDNFKKLNDKYGHDVGDSVLREFSKLLTSLLRTTDIIARWGGEEFIILLPNTNGETAVGTAEKLRIGIESRQFPKAGKLTASFGVTNFLITDTAVSAIKRADIALYRAKELGRNRVEILLAS